MLNLFSHNYDFLGIDINQHFIAFVALKNNLSVISIEACDVISISDVKNIDQEYIKAIKHFIKKYTIKTKYAYTNIASLQTIKKLIPFDTHLNDNDIAMQLNINQKQYFPNIDANLVFDFINKQQNNLKSHTKDFYVFASRASEISKRINVLKQAGLRAACIEPDSYALLRTILHAEKIKQNNLHVYILLHCENKQARTIIFNHEEILHEQYLSKDNHINFQQIIHGFQTSHPDIQIQNVFVPKETQHENFLQEEMLPAAIKIIDPFQSIECKKNIIGENKAQLLTALGLALRGAHANH